MIESTDNGKQIEVLREECGIEITPCSNIELFNSDKYIILRDKAIELSPLIETIPNLGTAMANYKAMGTMAYSITFNGHDVLPNQLFQKNNGAYLSNLQSKTGGGLGKQTDIHPIDFAKTQALNIANAVFGIASVATATYYLKNIDDKLSTIQAITYSIINFLEGDRQAQVKQDIDFLNDIIDEMDSIKSNESIRTSKSHATEEIIRTQGKNIHAYENILERKIKEYLQVKGNKKHLKADILRKNFEYYRLSIQVYATAKIVEMELNGWDDINHIAKLKKDFESRINQFKLIHDSILKNTFVVGSNSIKVKAIMIQANVYQEIGKFVEKTPASKFGVDNWLYDKANKKQKEANRNALADSFKALGEKRLNHIGFKRVFSVEQQQSIEPLLEIVSSMEITYNNPMKMIVLDNDIYLEITKDNKNS